MCVIIVLQLLSLMRHKCMLRIVKTSVQEVGDCPIGVFVYVIEATGKENAYAL